MAWAHQGKSIHLQSNKIRQFVWVSVQGSEDLLQDPAGAAVQGAEGKVRDGRLLQEASEGGRGESE